MYSQYKAFVSRAEAINEIRGRGMSEHFKVGYIYMPEHPLANKRSGNIIVAIWHGREVLREDGYTR